MTPTPKTQSYNEGYHSGFYWPPNWETRVKPAGPRIGSWQDKEAVQRNKDWRSGWHDGHAARLAADRKEADSPRGAEV